MLKILNLEPDNYTPEASAILQTLGTVDNGPLSRGQLKAALKDYEILILRLGHRIDAEILNHAPRLKLILTATTGLNHIDLDEAKRRHIEILSLKGEIDFLDTIRATAEHTIALILSLLRHIPAAAGNVLDGHWNRDAYKGHELYNRTLGIIGYGRLGKIVAQYALSFGMSVLAHDINPPSATDGIKFVDFETALRQSDIVSLHISYNPQNHHIMGKKAFETMKKNSVFINTSRGELVDENALLHFLQSHHLAGAALDVLQAENTINTNGMKKDPLVNYARNHNNLLITPHIGGATFESMEKTEIFMAEKLRNWLLKNQC